MSEQDLEELDLPMVTIVTLKKFIDGKNVFEHTSVPEDSKEDFDPSVNEYTVRMDQAFRYRDAGWAKIKGQAKPPAPDRSESVTLDVQNQVDEVNSQVGG